MTTVGPRTETEVPVVYDTDDRAIGGAGDMTGPHVGTLRYRQSTGDTLAIDIAVDFAHPNRTYDVTLTAGPSHDLGTGWVIVGQLVTGADGRGSTSLVVPPSVLGSAPFGPGTRADHVDMLQIGSTQTAGVLVAGAVNYFVCARINGPAGPGRDTSLHSRTRAAPSDGDPLDRTQPE